MVSGTSPLIALSLSFIFISSTVGWEFSSAIVYGCLIKELLSIISLFKPYSTILPPYITAILSASCIITLISCVISRIVRLSSSFNCFKSSIIFVWIVTSSPVVGSSAIRSAGSDESAIAIITLWHMPPLRPNG